FAYQSAWAPFAVAATVAAVVALFDRSRGTASLWGIACVTYLMVVSAVIALELHRDGEREWAAATAAASICAVCDGWQKLRPRLKPHAGGT
ncbi:MAG: hypothetical protein JWM12_3154, partial [Ilumatobacteraceae bacterium]|nr:hypothetical protein [Ilumatobacteraceae bacterium]